MLKTKSWLASQKDSAPTSLFARSHDRCINTKTPPPFLTFYKQSPNRFLMRSHRVDWQLVAVSGDLAASILRAVEETESSPETQLTNHVKSQKAAIIVSNAVKTHKIQNRSHNFCNTLLLCAPIRPNSTTNKAHFTHKIHSLFNHSSMFGHIDHVSQSQRCNRQTPPMRCRQPSVEGQGGE
jgi:hypothetical protein